MFQGFQMPNLVDEYNRIFLEKGGKTLNLSINVFPIFGFPSSNLMSFGILAQGFKMPNLVDEYKTIFWESGANVKTLQKFSPYIRVF